MEIRKSFLAFTRPGMDLGFRLGGAQVVTVFNEASLNAELESVIEMGVVGVLAVPEKMREWISDRNLKALKRSVFPMTVFYSYPSQWEEPYEIEDEVEMMIERAVGYRLRIHL